MRVRRMATSYATGVPGRTAAVTRTYGCTRRSRVHHGFTTRSGDDGAAERDHQIVAAAPAQRVAGRAVEGEVFRRGDVVPAVDVGGVARQRGLAEEHEQ